MDASLYTSLAKDMDMTHQNPEQSLTRHVLQNLLSQICEKQSLQSSSVQTTTQQKILNLVQNILSKPSQNRSSQQNSIVVSFSNKNKYLKKLQDEIGGDFVRNIMKYANILRLSPGKIIFEEKQSISHFYLVLNGKIGLKKTQQVSTDIDQSHIYQLLTIIAKKQAKNINKALQSKSIQPIKIFQQIKQPVEEIQQQFYGHAQKNQVLGLFDYCVSKQHLNTTITSTQCILLQFNVYYFLNFLDRSHNAKMKKQMGLFAHIPCFKFISTAKLEQFLGSMILRKKKRKQLIYKQGDPTLSIFLLIQGQVKITKNTNLFEQNPNNFYVDRSKLIDGKQNPFDRPAKVLPYANLTRLYNYRPVNKLIQIGVLSPVCLFGQQQMIQRRKREANAQCCSLQVQYYEIEIKRIEQIFGQITMDQFKIQVKNQVKKKILYRQNQYANTVQFENNKNLDYFYYDGQKEKDSPRKFNLTKINKRLSPTIDHVHGQSQQLPAYYTAFNFHKMANKEHLIGSKKSKRLKNYDHSLDQSQISKDPVERRIIDISHTWGPMTRKIKQSLQLSRKLSPSKQSIDIQSPLFEPKFFMDMYLQNKRIDKNYRTKKLGLGLIGKKNKNTIDSQRYQN